MSAGVYTLAGDDIGDIPVAILNEYAGTSPSWDRTQTMMAIDGDAVARAAGARLQRSVDQVMAQWPKLPRFTACDGCNEDVADCVCDRMCNDCHMLVSECCCAPLCHCWICARG